MSRKPITVDVQVSAEEVALLKRIADFMESGTGRSPQRHEIVASKSRHRTVEQTRDIKRFARLVLLGLIEHRSNGHCWLTHTAHELLVKVSKAGAA